MPSLQIKVPLPEQLRSAVPHTIVRDRQGNLYFSDEFNHTLISLDSGGALRWKLGGKGKSEGQFFYPRGIALGQILIKGKSETCLAVCDAWNNRVQFFDLRGGYICSWHAAGERSFNQVCDIRYVTSPGTDSPGCWYVLDRANHRLCALRIDAQPLFELGKAFPPSLEPSWFNAGLDSPQTPARDRLAHLFSNYEPLYYPVKILGQSETALYLFEPLFNELKQPLFGSLLPLYLRPPDGSEWISATDDVFLSWNPKTRCLIWMDSSNDILHEASIEGSPVNSDAGKQELWLHTKDCLELWHFEFPAKHAGSEIDRRPFAALISAAREEMVSGSLAAVFRPLLVGVTKSLQICDEYRDAVWTGCRDAAILGSIQKNLISCWRETVEPDKPTNAQIRKFRLACLKLPILEQHGDVSETLRMLRTGLEGSIKDITDAIIECTQHRDQAILLRHNLLYNIQDADAPAITGLAELINFQLLMIKELLFYCGSESPRMELHPSPSESSVAEESPWIAPRRARFFSPVSRCLHELAQFSIVPPNSNDLPNAHCVVQTSDGDYFVTLFSRGSLVHLDRDGTFVEEIFGPGSTCGTLARPTGLTIDNDGRLWIVEQLGMSVKIYDPRNPGSPKNLAVVDTSDLLNSPVGIGRGPDGTMLVADLGSQRLIKLRATGRAEVFCDRVGTGPGEFRCPTGICASAIDSDSGFWIVDQRNHRLQKLDGSGQFVQQIGQCGLGRGSFLAPWFSAQFEDGILAVSQTEIEPCLKLITPEGMEVDCLFLEYMPAGLFVRDGKLIVTECDGRSIRIYERTR